MKQAWRSFAERPFARAVARYWLSFAFVLGFATDLMLLNQVDNIVDNAILLFYVVLATTSMLAFYLGVAQRLPERVSAFCERYMPVLMQYSFGGLLSGMLIFYGRSGDIVTSAPFYLLLIGVVFGNELIKKRSNRLLFHLALYFIGVFAYLVLLLPVVTGKMGDVIFVASGLMALALVVFLIKLLILIIPNFVTLQIRSIVFVLGCVYVTFNVFYFLNIIPPIPLSLTELGVYHRVERTAAGGYRLFTEDRAWWEMLPLVTHVIHPRAGEGVACFARVYAPTTLSTDIFHHWEYYDEAAGAWKNHFRMSYRISGENANGYGGYTEISNVRSGLWRCTVETRRGQVLGRYRFYIDTTRAPDTLTTLIK